MIPKESVFYRALMLPTAVVLLTCSVGPIASVAQSRLSDKDVEKVMENLRDGADKFRSSFNSAIGKSALRNTDQEKQGKALVQQFQTQMEDFVNHYRRNKSAEADLKNVRESAAEINRLLMSTPMGNEVTGNWDKIKGGLINISEAFGMESPFSDQTAVK